MVETWDQLWAVIRRTPDARPQSNGSCGDCTACCTTMAIETGVPDPTNPLTVIPKPGGERCPWLDGKKADGSALGGCAIYAMRPAECREFDCWARFFINGGRRDLYHKARKQLKAEGLRTV